MNTVTPHGLRPVDTTVGELEPGTVFRVEGRVEWMYRIHGNSGVTATLLNSGGWTRGRKFRVVEIADSVTITKITEE